MYKKSERIGERNKNKHGTEMILIEYIRKDNVIVEFQDEYKYKIKTTYQNFKLGYVNNPYDKIVFGIGYVGEGKYNRTYDRKLYNTWYHMLLRCYDPYSLNSKNITYRDCIVDKRFHCLQDFGKWFEENYYEIPGEQMCLDKDILCKGNKVYSRDTCIFVPQTINSLIVKSYITKHDNLPIGVCYHKSHNKYMASCSILVNNKNKIITIGYYDDSITAFNAYKLFKEKYIKTVADKYKNYIPEKLYKALYNYIVEIND